MGVMAETPVKIAVIGAGTLRGSRNSFHLGLSNSWPTLENTVPALGINSTRASTLQANITGTDM